MKVCLVVASSGKNLELGQRIRQILSEKKIESEWLELVPLDLPLYTSPSEANYVAADLMAPYQAQLSSPAFIFITPEYNGGIPPVLTNFLAWTSRATKNWRDAFNGKPAMLVTFSAGTGLNVLPALRLQLSYIGMNVMGRQLAVTPKTPVEDATIVVMVEQLVKMVRA